jgi:hypothetical protein
MVDVKKNCCQNLIGKKLNVAAALASTTREPTGFKDPENVIVSYDSTARTITLGGTVEAYYRLIEFKEVFSGYVSPAHPDITGVYFLAYDGNSISWKNPADVEFFDLLIAYALYTPGFKWGLRECHGLMQWQSHRSDHYTIGTYREPESGGLIGDYVLSSSTASDRRPSITQDTIRDEDLPSIIPSLAAGVNYTNAFLSSTDTVNYDLTAAEIVPVVGSRPNYNQLSGGNYIQTPISNNFYMSVWLLEIPATADSGSQEYRHQWWQGQSQSSTLLGEEGKTTLDLSLGELNDLNPESVFVGRVIIRYQGGNWFFIKVEEIKGTRVNQSQGASPVVQNEFTDDLFRILYNLNTANKLGFDLSLLTASRTLTAQNKNGTIALISDIAGYSQGGLASYVGTTSASIAPFKLEVNGSILARSTAYVVTVGGIPGAIAYLYVYAESDGAGGVTISESTTGPTFDFDKNGWYKAGGDARLVNIVPLLGTAIRPFTVVQLSENYFRMVFNWVELSLDQDPDGTWQTPNTTNVSSVSPVNTEEVRILLENYRGAGSLAMPGWIADELSAAVPPSRGVAVDSWSEKCMGPSAFVPAEYGNNARRRWGSLGASRDIRISDDNTNLNRLSTWLEGVGYGR